MNIYPMHLADFYKVGHIGMYPEGSEYLYSNFTPRSDRLAKVLPDFDHKVVNFGIGGMCKWFLRDTWNTEFFNKPKEIAVKKFADRINKAGLGPAKVDHVAALHDLGFLPIVVKALPEGARVNIKVPIYTIRNTLPGFGWLTNYLESVMSSETWKPITTATTAYEYHRLLKKYAEKTGSAPEFVAWQGHSFSFRGLSGFHDSMTSDSGHLLSFYGTDTIPAIDYLEDYYGAGETFVGGSVNASEHSCSIANILALSDSDYDSLEKEFVENYGSAVPVEYDRKLLLGEYHMFKRMTTDVVPSGIVSLVSDSFNYWGVLTVIAPALKKTIMNRPVNELGLSKVVFRPDSGDPVRIICGDEIPDLTNDCEDLEDAKEYMMETIRHHVGDNTPHGEEGDWQVTRLFQYGNEYYRIKVEIEWNRYDKQYYYIDGSTIKSCVETVPTPEELGSLRLLWKTFGGTTTSTGHRMLDSHVGLIYGDSITLERAQEILRRMDEMGFASGNIVFGIGSYQYQCVTRDSFGCAVKATYCQVNGQGYELFKDPITDNGTKKSAKGLLRVEKEGDNYVLYDQQTWEQEAGGELREIFRDSVVKSTDDLAIIRARLGAVV